MTDVVFDALDPRRHEPRLSRGPRRGNQVDLGADLGVRADDDETLRATAPDPQVEFFVVFLQHQDIGAHRLAQRMSPALPRPVRVVEAVVKQDPAVAPGQAAAATLEPVFQELPGVEIFDEDRVDLVATCIDRVGAEAVLWTQLQGCEVEVLVALGEGVLVEVDGLASEHLIVSLLVSPSILCIAIPGSPTVARILVSLLGAAVVQPRALLAGYGAVVFTDAGAHLRIQVLTQRPCAGVEDRLGVGPLGLHVDRHGRVGLVAQPAVLVDGGVAEQGPADRPRIWARRPEPPGRLAHETGSRRKMGSPRPRSAWSSAKIATTLAGAGSWGSS